MSGNEFIYKAQAAIDFLAPACRFRLQCLDGKKEESSQVDQCTGDDHEQDVECGFSLFEITACGIDDGQHKE